ncbi:cupin domain-containing protein [Chryseolinea sp. T2]|uniref:cupin domain-containing protein n=1 Tax=Chryseolinea sp. T2 TaxID=3129255 RepID=UPI00307894EB
MSFDEIIKSGLLHQYVAGIVPGDISEMIEAALMRDPALRQELRRIELGLFAEAQASAIEPSPTIKPLLMARIDYLNRLKNGEVPETVPVLSSQSQIGDYERWLRRSDMQLNHDFDQGQVNIISIEPDKMTAIVWLSVGAPPEIHEAEYEKFLIIEGSCRLTIGTATYDLMPGDYSTVPLFERHSVKVTSAAPCKFILQRVKV